jgi:DNA-binding HxlR family transcriptional regulator
MVTMKNGQNDSLTHHCSGDSCEIRDAFLIIGGKWKSMILYALASEGVVRFNQLKKLVAGISQKMLTQQLRELERDGLITRVIYPEIPPRVEYSMTKLGMSLGPIYQMVHKWEQENYSTIAKCRKNYDSSQNQS